MTEQHLSTQAPAELPDWLDQQVAGGDAQAAAPVRQRLSTFGVIGIVVVLGLLAVIGYALIQRGKGTLTEGPAPDFTVTMFESDRLAMSGQKSSLKDLRGQVVVINFWASYCEPCKDEAPMLERVWTDYQARGVVFLGLNINDPLTNALDYLAEYGITYPNAPDKGNTISDDKFRITGIPETFVINKEGEIIRHFLSQPNERDLRSEIDRALSS